MRRLIRKHKTYSMLAALCLGATLLWAGGLGLDLFELDGNAVDDSGGGADWATLYASGALNGTITGLERYTFVPEPNRSASIFTGGGSKDNNNINEWAWKDGSGGLPDKDNLLNASAAAVRLATGPSTGERVIYLHADRYANDGDAEMGFWIFQNEIKLGTNKVGGGTGFDGLHKDGDVFVRATFTNGGAVVTITVFEWKAGEPDNMKILLAETAAKCGVGTNEEACGITNTTNQSSPWPYQSKSLDNQPNVYPFFSFFEVAVNISQLFQRAGEPEPPCFSSFMAETRSSHGFDSTSKDFVLGSFPLCSVEISKGCQCTGFDAAGPNPSTNTGFNYRAGGIVTAKGGTVYNVVVTDKGLTFDCGTVTAAQPKTYGDPNAIPVPTSTLCASSGAGTGVFTDDIFPTTNQASVVAYTAASGGTQLTDQTDSITCDTDSPSGACVPNPQLTVDKLCVTALQVEGDRVVVRVDYTGKVYNNGNVNLGSVQVTEDHNAAGVDQTFNIGVLAALSDICYTNNQANCPSLTLPNFNAPTVTGAASYFPNTGTGVNPGRVKFTDKVRATGINPFGGATVESHPVGGGYSWTCAVCPLGACPTAP